MGKERPRLSPIDHPLGSNFYCLPNLPLLSTLENKLVFHPSGDATRDYYRLQGTERDVQVDGEKWFICSSNLACSAGVLLASERSVLRDVCGRHLGGTPLYLFA